MRVPSLHPQSVHTVIFASILLLGSAGILRHVLWNSERDQWGDVVFQKGRNGCAPAATAMVLQSLGQGVNPEDVDAAYDLSEEGASVQQVLQVLHTFGVEAQAWRIGTTTLDTLRVPAILHLDASHFVVLDSVGEQNVWLRDPASGTVTLRRTELDARWSGVTVVVTAVPSRP